MTVDPKTAGQGTIVFDLDGTLCTNTYGEYESAQPHAWAIERVNALAEAGHRIVILTARGSATGIDWEQTTHEQLQRWGVRYDELRLGKPSGGVYVDDRAVHTDDWRRSDSFLPPGHPLVAGDGLPPAPPAHLTAVAEVGRTFGGEPLRVGEHAARAARLAAAAEVPSAPTAEELERLATEALGTARVPEGDDVVYAISIAAPSHPAFLDAWRFAPGAAAQPTPVVRVSRRPLGEVASALAPPLAATPEGPPAVRASTEAVAGNSPTGAWSLEVGPDGVARDALGGTLAVAVGGELRLGRPGRGDVACDWLIELAERTGVALAAEPVDAEALRTCDEAAIVAMPFCVLPIASVDERHLDAGPDSTCAALLAAWSEDSGVDIGAQLAALRSER